MGKGIFQARSLPVLSRQVLSLPVKVPLTADIEGSGLWRPILRDTHLHLHLKSWMKGLGDPQGLFGSRSIIHFFLHTYSVMCIKDTAGS